MNDAPAPIERAVLAGYLRVIAPPPGFVVPLFRAPELSGADCAPSYLIQEIDAEQTITGFTPLDPGGGDVVAAAQPAEKRVGEPCALGYELSPGNVVSGTHAELRARLRGCVNEAGLRERPFALWEVADFCGLVEPMLEIARQVGLGRTAGRSRSLAFFGNGVLAKSIVRARLAAVAGGQSLPAGSFHVVERGGALAIEPGEGLSAEMHVAVSVALAEIARKEPGAPGGGIGDQEDPNRPISLFYVYSRRDEDLRSSLEKYLAMLPRNKRITEWHDRMVGAGEEWKNSIDRHLIEAEIILLLVSPGFLASDYCWMEMTEALERNDRGEARVIPIILMPCQWQSTPVAKLQVLPSDAKPVTAWADRGAAFKDVVGAIGRVVDEILCERAARAKAEATPVVIRTPGGAGIVHVGVDPRTLPDLAVFKDVDAPWCPEMVALPAGTFLMGSPGKEEGRDNDEDPQHEVTIGSRFALGRYPVTVEEYRKFVEATGHRHEGGMYVWTGSDWKQDASKSWQDPGFAQTDRNPVVGVSWRDAVGYCEWLAKETGRPYRLPSEAEWEYPCRAGTTTRYSVGDEITEKDANFGGKLGKTSEVGAYPPNPWSLYDMHGNVWEWVEDVWHDTYQGAPTDGSAWTEGEGKYSSRNRVIRGGSWGNYPRYLRSANRSGYPPENRYVYLGFRVARTLS